jgi:hypothetical protein
MPHIYNALEGFYEKVMQLIDYQSIVGIFGGGGGKYLIINDLCPIPPLSEGGGQRDSVLFCAKIILLVHEKHVGLIWVQR